MSEPVDAEAFKAIAGHFATGVVVVTGADGGGPVGITCQSFASLSLAPPLVLFCPSSGSYTWSRLRASGHFCVNILDATQHDLCMTFASKAPDRFTGVRWQAAPSGSPIVDDVLCWLDCRIDAVHRSGDHDIVVGEVLDLGGREILPHESPLIYFRGGFGQLTQAGATG